MGDTTTHDRLVREVAVGAHAAVVFVNYDRSPEAHYPVAIEEDYAVTKYVAEHPREFNIDAAGLAIAGDSVGGNRVGGMMAAAITCAKSCRTPLGARRQPGLHGRSGIWCRRRPPSSHERHWRLEVADCEVGLVGVGQLQIVEVAAWLAQIRPGVPGPMRQRNELVGRDAEGADIG